MMDLTRFEISLPDLLFYVFSAVSLAGAMLVLVQRNPMSCAVSLVVSVLGLAVLYVLLSAHFIAAAQMIVYAGAIIVLFIFVIMLLNLSSAEIGRFRFSLFKTAGLFAGLIVLLLILPGLRHAPPGDSPDVGRYGDVRTVGEALFGQFVLPFELTSVLILSAMVAGVVLAKRDLTPKRPFSFLDWVLGLFKN